MPVDPFGETMGETGCLHERRRVQVVPGNSVAPEPEQVITYCVDCREILGLESRMLTPPERKRLLKAVPA